MPSRFLVTPELLSEARAVLTGAELHHLQVRRLRLGDEVILSDGLGHERKGVLVALDRGHATVNFGGEAAVPRESILRLVLAQAALKGDKMDVVIDKVTQLGVSEIVVFTCERSLGRASPDRQARWQRIARSATKQCQRSTVPAITGPISLDQLLARAEPLRLLFSERESAGRLADLRESPDAVLAVAGPEGGFSAIEQEQAAVRGFRAIGLGPRTLRAETAAVVAVALCQFLWGDLNGSHP